MRTVHSNNGLLTPPKEKNKANGQILCSTKMKSEQGGGYQSLAGAVSSSPMDKIVSPQNGKPSGGSGSGNNSPKLSHDVADISLEGAQDGEWEVCARKSKNRAGTGAAKENPWGPQSLGPKAWGQPNTAQKLGLASNGGRGRSPGDVWQTQVTDPGRPVGRGNPKANSSNRGRENAYMAPLPHLCPPLQHRGQQSSHAGGQPRASEDGLGNVKNSKLYVGSAGRDENYGYGMGSCHYPVDVDVDDDGEPLDDDDDDDDDILTDDYDSDRSSKSHETLKKSKWFKVFFDALDNLTIEQINESMRRWHCPACKGGPGGIDWYRGLQPLVTHAKTKGAKRVKLHRQFAKLLDEELRVRVSSFIPAGESYGKWKGLQQMVTDKEIVWPPIVVIMNTRLDQNENDEWIGMGNLELLDYFSSYAAVKAQHSSGPQGHQGMSVLIFESSAMGYVEAERLDEHFCKEGTHREGWEHRRVLFSEGGKRQLYGFMACKEDLDIFNQHHGKSKLKFEIKSYQEMVVGPMKKMREDNQQLNYFKNKVVKEQRHAKAIEQSFGVLNEKLQKIMEDNLNVRQRMKVQHEKNKQEMVCQENFFKDQISFIQQSLEEKERNFEKQLQEERRKMKQSNLNFKSKEDQELRGKEMGRFIQAQEKGVEEFEAERENLIRLHESKKAEIKKRHFEEEIRLEKEFETAMTELMSKYTPVHSRESNVSNSQV